MFEYNTCPICNKLTDDGAVVCINNYYYLVCFDCADQLDENGKPISAEQLERLVKLSLETRRF